MFTSALDRNQPWGLKAECNEKDQVLAWQLACDKSGMVSPALKDRLKHCYDQSTVLLWDAVQGSYWPS